jgi:hypothetical protein
MGIGRRGEFNNSLAFSIAWDARTKILPATSPSVMLVTLPLASAAQVL